MDTLSHNEGLKAVIYAFLQYRNQERGIGLQKQVRSCWDFCNKNGWKVRYIFIDQCRSEGTTRKPDLNQVIEIAQKENLDIIVFREFGEPRVSRVNHVKATHAQWQCTSRLQ